MKKIHSMRVRDALFGQVYLVDDDAAHRVELGAILGAAGFCVAGFGSTADLLAELGALGPGCIVCGLAPGSADAAALQRELAARAWSYPVIALTPAADVAAAVVAMKAGAVDVVVRPVLPEDLLDAVRSALHGVGGGEGDSAAQAVHERLARLTRRERQVLEGMVRGQPNKAIAHELGISPRTVEVHRAKVMEKLACRSLPDIVRLALQGGIGGA